MLTFVQLYLDYSVYQMTYVILIIFSGSDAAYLLY